MPPTDSTTPLVRPSQTKIVATVGPACDKEEQLADLMSAGVDVFRLNMAHGRPQEQETRLAAIRRASQRLGWPVAVLADLAGPKMRLGELPDGQLTLQKDEKIRFVRTPAAGSPQVPELTTTYEPLLDELAPGDRIMLADGTVSLIVEQATPDYAECRVVQPGVIRSRQGVNLPGVKLSVAAMSPVDRENAVWAARQDIDFVGLSFVRRAEEIRELKALLASVRKGDGATGPQVIAKIEKPEALEHLFEIVEATDGVMVARGDLGVETDIARVAVVQKTIIAECNRRRRPVICATQMLDSMTHSRIPTRAEVADVSNAILDGADACMLSGETAIGEYPRETVEMMHRIALATEPLCRSRQAAAGLSPVPPPSPAEGIAGLNPITEATVSAAGRLAETIEARAIIVASTSGATALSLAKHHFSVPTIGVSGLPATLRRMCLYWGVIPLVDAPIGDSATLVRHVAQWGTKVGLLASGDRVVLIAGTGQSFSVHNMIVVCQLP